MRFLLLSMLLSACLNISSQETFHFSLALNEVESSAAYQVFGIDESYYFSGDYFDQSIGRWTIFFAKLDKSGDLSSLKTEVIDTLSMTGTSNSVFYFDNSLYLLSNSPFSNNITRYNTINDTISTFSELNFSEFDFAGYGLNKINEDSFLISGNSISNFNFRNIKIVKVLNGEITQKEIIDVENANICSEPVIDDSGNIYLIGIDIKNTSNNLAYLLVFDSDMNIKYSSKGVGKTFAINSINNLFLDSRNNLLILGNEFSNSTNSFIPKVIKMDTFGNILWNNEVGKSNINNSIGRGAWNKIIESANKDHYILAGGNSYQTINGDTSILNACIAKVDLDCNLKWFRAHNCREGKNKVFCSFNDIQICEDGGYIAVGQSQNSSKPTSEIGDPPGFRSIIYKFSEEGLLNNDSTSHISEQSFFINVYPNPAIDIINIKNASGRSYECEIFDMSGKKVKSLNIVPGLNTFNNLLFESGHYIFSFLNDGFIETSFIIKMI